MYVYITISNAGVDLGPFDLYSDLDGYVAPFEVNVSKASMEAGLASHNAPDGTTIVKVKSANAYCNNFVLANVPNNEF